MGNQNIANPRFRLGSCSRPGHCVRSYETAGWTRAKVEQLHAWIDKQEAVPRTAEELDYGGGGGGVGERLGSMSCSR